MAVDWIAGFTAPAWMRLMSSRFVTRWVRRSLWASMVLANSRACSGSQSISSSSMLVAAALIDAMGVRRSCDTAVQDRSAEAVGLGPARWPLLHGFRSEPDPLLGLPELSDEGSEQRRVLGVERLPGEDQHEPHRASSAENGAASWSILGGGDWLGPAAATVHQRLARPGREWRRRDEIERAPQLG